MNKATINPSLYRSPPYVCNFKMGCSSSHPIREDPQLHIVRRNSPPEKASSQNITIPTPHLACTAEMSSPEPSHSLPTDEESHHISSESLHTAQIAPETQTDHYLQPNSAESRTTSPEPVSAAQNTTAAAQSSPEDINATTANLIQPAAMDPVPENDERQKGAEGTLCNYCTDVFIMNDDLVLYPCDRCESRCCTSCLRKFFLNACKDEYSMPPRCCKPIPLAFARSVLSETEVTLFKEKHEEWSTPDRIYCPIPTCSAFIPPRLFPVPAQKVDDVKEIWEPEKYPNSTSLVHTPPPTPPESYFPEPSQLTTSISCPKCEAKICCSCKQLSHDGCPCPEVRDIDPELERSLRKWGYKRCPKCRNAVRRMWGCNHMQCRCGAQWCWRCKGPIEVCNRQGCPTEDEVEKAEDPSAASDAGENLDYDSDWEERSGYDFGEEPNSEKIDPLTCQHSWETIMETDIDPHLEYDCERCWRKVVPRSWAVHYLGIKDLVDTGSLHEQSQNEDESFHSESATMQQCYACGVIMCSDCRDKWNTNSKVTGI